jgi:type 1 glutamine amidotransferase
MADLGSYRRGVTPVTTSAQSPGSRRALVVRGGWDGHVPVESTDRFIPFLRDSGFTVEVSDTLDAYLDADLLAATDLVLQIWTMGEITPEQRKGLDAAVRAGTGLAGWHGGIADAFRADLEYNFMVGGQFICHPGGFVDHEVEIVADRADHPIVQGIERFALHTEQYYVHADPSIDVLASTTFAAHPDYPWIDGVTMPAVWTKPWGSGRVFVCTVGHKLDDLDTPEVRTIIERGLLWASR